MEKGSDGTQKKIANSHPSTVSTAEKEERGDHYKEVTGIAGNAAIAAIGDFINGIVGYTTNVAMTHLVSPIIYGIFAEVYTAAIIIGWIVKLGFDGVLIRFLPVYRAHDRQDLVRGLVRFTVWVTLISGVSIGGLVFAGAALIARVFYHNPLYTIPVQEVALLIPLTALQWVLSASLQAYKEIKWKVYVDRFSQPFITLTALIIFHFLGWRIEALSFATISGYFCSVLIGQVALSRILKRDMNYARCSYAPRTWLSTSAPLFFSGLIFGILNSADVLFLSTFSTPVNAAIYVATNRVSNLTMMPLVALNVIFLPVMAEYNAANKHAQLESMLKLVTKWSLSLSLPVFLASLIFHDPILGIFGAQYRAGGLALIILCIGSVMNSGAGSVLQLLAITGHLRTVSINSIITIGINVVLSFILVPSLNILGVALAEACSVIILNGLCLVEVYWLMRIHPYRWDMYKPVLAGAVAFVVGLVLTHVIHPGSGPSGRIEELSLLLPFILVYALVMVLLRFSAEDHMVFDAVLARFRFGTKRSPLS